VNSFLKHLSRTPHHKPDHCPGYEPVVSAIKVLPADVKKPGRTLTFIQPDHLLKVRVIVPQEDGREILHEHIVEIGILYVSGALAIAVDGETVFNKLKP